MEERYGAILGSAMEATDGSRRQQTSAEIVEIVPEGAAAQ
jgi:hypothetical protein